MCGDYMGGGRAHPSAIGMEFNMKSQQMQRGIDRRSTGVSEFPRSSNGSGANAPERTTPLPGKSLSERNSIKLFQPPAFAERKARFLVRLAAIPLQGIAEGAMADSKFWRRTGKKFRRLQAPPPHPGEVAHASHNGLCAWWMPDGWPDGNTYRLFNDGDDIEANRNIERLFKIVAESAEVELGHPGGEAAVFAWLDRLRLEGIYVAPFTAGSQIIHRVCDASAEYCLKCETDAKAGAREREGVFGGSAVSPSLAESEVSLSSPEDDAKSVPSPDAGKDLDFATEGGRNAAVVAYTKQWTCSEAALARAARVHPGDLSKWKKCRLPARSDKRARIEKAFTTNEKPVPPAQRFES